MAKKHNAPEISAPQFIGIGKALKGYKLEVPRFQRSYAWAADNVEQLFQDIATAINDEEEIYFLGSIVTIQTEDGKLEIADGQQRLATTTILLAAIRDYYHSKNDTKREERIEQDYLYSEDLVTLDKEQNLTLNANDNDFFLSCVLHKPGDPERSITPSKPSHRNIATAAAIAAERVSKIASETNEPSVKLAKWARFLEENAKVIWFSVSSDINAFIIFETLNDRGLDLTLADMLKNYVLSRSGGRVEEVENLWLSMISAFDLFGLEAQDGNKVITRYIHTFWSSRFGLTRERDLYREIKKNFVSPGEVVKFTRDLDSNTRLYMALTNPEHDLWEPFDNKLAKYKVKHCIRAFSTLKLEQNRTLLLAVLRKFTEEEIAKTINALLSWSVRLIVGGGGGGTLEKKYPYIAREISDGTVTTANDVFAHMQDIVPTDQQFHDTIATAAFARANLARFLLIEIEKFKSATSGPEVAPLLDVHSVNLEHILPQTLTAEWSHFTSEMHKTYRNRLGNQTLLSARINSQIKVSAFHDKQAHYRDSKFLITNELANETQWTDAEIDKRQKQFADLAVKIWKLKPIQ